MVPRAFETTSSCQTLASSGKLRDSLITIFGDRSDRHPVGHFDKVGQEHADKVAERQAGLDQCGTKPFDVGHDGIAYDGPEQLLLVLEIEIERALRHAGPLRDLVEPGGGEAFFGENFERRRANLSRPIFCTALPTGSFHELFLTDRSVLLISQTERKRNLQA